MFTTHLLGMALAPNKCMKNQLELAIYFVTSPMNFTVFRKTIENPISNLTANNFESGPMLTPGKFSDGLPLLPNCKLG